jgi:hypothetical protein
LYPTSLDVGDFDGDGHLDIVVASDSYDVELLKGDGAGDFDREEGEGLGENLLLAGDVDGDGDLDVVTFSNWANEVVSYVNRDGDLAQAATAGLSTDANEVAAADLDGDGVLDLVVAGNTRVVVLAGDP